MKKLNYPNLRLSLELGEEKNLSGSDLFALLHNIDALGSISKAAAQLGISYRYAWGLLKDAEKAINTQLVKKVVGGYAGGGAYLTEEGKLFLKKYRTLKREIDMQIAEAFPGEGQKPEGASDIPGPDTQGFSHLLLASTIEPVETGLLDLLEQAFFNETGILIKHIAAGSGRALEIAKAGRVDMVLSHAPQLESQFVEEGYGKIIKPVMKNNYIIVGPKGNNIFANNGQKAVVSPIEAFKKIAQEQAIFISRNDMSGTHLKEQEIWAKAGITHKGYWYIKSPGLMGNLGVLQLAIEKSAYTIVDYATFLLANGKESLSIICDASKDGSKTEGAENSLENVFSLILVNPEFMPTVHFKEAMLFAKWLDQESTKNIIANFGILNYKEPLFTVI